MLTVVCERREMKKKLVYLNSSRDFGLLTMNV